MNVTHITPPATLQALIKAGYDVTRWHTFPNSRPQNLASHLWGVAMIISRTFEGNPNELIALLKCALEHDLAESVLGDIPRPSKTEEQQKEEVRIATAMGIWHEEFLPEHTHKWLKWADLIEAGLHCQREIIVGNQNFTETLLKISEYINASEQQIPPPLFKFARQAGLIL